MLHASQSEIKHKSPSCSAHPAPMPARPEQGRELNAPWADRVSTLSASTGRSGIAALQRAYGNQAILRAVEKRPAPQAGVPVLQRKSDCGDECPTCRAESAISLSRLPERAVRSSAPNTDDVPEIQQSHGEPLEPSLLPRAQAVFGADFSTVRVHTGGSAQTACARLGARAFTVDQQIYFGSGFWRPDSEAGLALIGHELTHVVQQRRGLSASDLKGPGDAYEQEADKGGQSFLKMGSIRISSSQGSSSAIQRSEDPGADADYVGVDDSPYGLPFLGEANSPEELTDLMQSLAGGAALALVPEDYAMSKAPSGDAVAANDGSPGSDVGAEAQTSSLGRPLQMAVVAGCNVPGVPANVIGMAAHAQIEETCEGTAPGCTGEFRIPGDGQADMVRKMIPAIDVRLARSSQPHGSAVG